MSAETKRLFEINYVTDHDCGNYHIGEVDYRLDQDFYDYIKQYKRKGKDEIIKMLSHFIFMVEQEFRKLPDEDAAQMCESK